MERLWAPWRVEYLRKPGGECFLCAALRAREPDKHLIVERWDKAFTIMNRYPYSNGHLMVVPVRHVALLEDLDDEEVLQIHRLCGRSIQALGKAMKPQGYNIGVNQGQVAGAGVATHVHVHVVPRWQGDTNFMPVIGDTKVVSEALSDTYRAITRALAELDRP